MTLAGAYFFGSGNYFQSLTGLNPFGSDAGQRLRLDGSVIPIRDLKRPRFFPNWTCVCRRTFDWQGASEWAGTAEAFQPAEPCELRRLYNVVEGLANYGQPTRHLGTMYMPRSAQLGVRLSF